MIGIWGKIDRELGPLEPLSELLRGRYRSGDGP